MHSEKYNHLYRYCKVQLSYNCLMYNTKFPTKLKNKRWFKQQLKMENKLAAWADFCEQQLEQKSQQVIGAIVENLTKERAHDLCVEMWNEIAENGYYDKTQSYLIKKYRPYDLCFACEFYGQVLNKDNSCLCDNCPFTNIWKGGCYDENSPYEMWVNRPDKKYAIAIADLFID